MAGLVATTVYNPVWETVGLGKVDVKPLGPVQAMVAAGMPALA